MVRPSPIVAALACLLGPVACDDGPHQTEPHARLLVAVWTDLEIPGHIDGIEAALRQDTEEVDEARPLDPRGEPQPVVLPLRLGYLRRTRPLDLVVTGRGAGLTVVERRMRFDRLPAGDSAVAVTLEARCAAVACDEGWTCVHGHCERVEVSGEILAASVEDLPPDPLGTLVEGRRIDGCETDADCEDGDPCTIDGCAAHQCYSTPVHSCILCETDDVCEPFSRMCLEGYCHPYGVCQGRPRRAGTRCDTDDDPWTVECCRELGVCLAFDIREYTWEETGCDPD